MKYVVKAVYKNKLIVFLYFFTLLSARNVFGSFNEVAVNSQYVGNHNKAGHSYQSYNDTVTDRGQVCFTNRSFNLYIQIWLR